MSAPRAKEVRAQGIPPGPPGLQACPLLRPTARIARAAFLEGGPYFPLRDELGPVFRDGDPADLYPRGDQPALPPWRLAPVTLLQSGEDLADRRVADAVHPRIDRKFVC